MMLGLLCSGQGLQSESMFTLTAHEPQAIPIFESAAALLNCDPRRLAMSADNATLYSNVVGQILCVTQALAIHACVRQVCPDRLVVAGYSVGEMAAWSIAGAWTEVETLSLVATRAEIMDRHSPPGDCLGAVRGLNRSRVERLGDRLGCAIAIVNPDHLFIVGGAACVVEQFCKEALMLGARQASRLPIAIASHTRRLAGAILPFQLALESVRSQGLRRSITLLSGADGEPIMDVNLGISKLARQLGSTLEWASCLDGMAEAGVSRILELGPGRALANMARSQPLFAEIRAADDFKTLDGMKRWIAHD
jgi:[acyl-carrier-protein] S-malonyltransferase